MTPPQNRTKHFLAASLMVNLFLAGALGGGIYEWSSHRKPVGSLPQHGLRQALAQLPEARRHELRHLLRKTRIDSEQLIVARREARQDVARQLKAQTLDRNALDSELGKAREADIALRSRVDMTLADFASTLDPDEREKLADSMQGHTRADAQN